MALINTTTTGVLGSTFYGDGTGPLTIQQDGSQIAKITKNPTFFAWQSTQQTGIGVATATKVNFQSIVFDTDGCFSTSLSRFTPTVAGYYLLSAAIQLPVAASTATVNLSIYKNGSEWVNGNSAVGSSILYAVSVSTGIFYMNGTTDYAECYTYGSNNGSTYSLLNNQTRTNFQGTLIKAV